MKFFVENNSIVRKIWGRSDTILFIFAGAAAEFSLNKAVDWLYFTGKLPSDPLGRLFSTVSYARKIVFAPRREAENAIDHISLIHKNVEKSRGANIPDWAYKDVLFMLIYYSISSYELLERKLNAVEKEEVYNVFYRVGDRMGLKDLPRDYNSWLIIRTQHINDNLKNSAFTKDLYHQYRLHLGLFRYKLLLEAQKLVIPSRVRQLLYLNTFSMLKPTVPLYKISMWMRMDRFIKSILLPSEYLDQILELDVQDT